ncbi:hypothetical protein KEM56_001513 [Ascosphaera pollenicola]|nr:hypothetical protein KEM56_001513 [Ascosphaera pollenicola]
MSARSDNYAVYYQHQQQQPSPPPPPYVRPRPRHITFLLAPQESGKDGDDEKNEQTEKKEKEKGTCERKPLCVGIHPHDSTESIVTTVKEYYGIHDGVSFENKNGETLIMKYENLDLEMTVYVRVIPGTGGGERERGQSQGQGQGQRGYTAPVVSPFPYTTNIPQRAATASARPTLGEPFKQLPRTSTSPLRSSSRSSTRRRSTATARSSRSVKTRGSSAQHDEYYDDQSESESDGSASPTSSRRPRMEQMPSSDISKDNILQDSRRKKPKFESSELPLYAPPQNPFTTSHSSVSPQRRAVQQTSPYTRPAGAQQPYAHQPFPSPQSLAHHDQAYGFQTPVQPTYPPQYTNQLRNRQAVNPYAQGAPILPTPDPTIASCISDEDVAVQLLRLHDASNFSHGRKSASTYDDGFSQVAGPSETEDSDADIEMHDRREESSPLLPPGMVRRQHKKLDEILPSCETSDTSDEDHNYRVAEQDDAENDTADQFIAPVYEEALALPRAKRARTVNKSTSRKNSTARGTTKSRSGSTAGAGSRKGSKVWNTAIAPSTVTPTAVATTPVSTAATSVATSTSSNGHVFAVPPLPQQMISPVTAARKLSAASSISSNTATHSAAYSYHHGAAKPVNPPQPAASGAGLPALTPEEEDLSTKPRCQRCRKSKKGCDRQRPCQRCKDAGIGIEGCVSEDEGNGRKGRYGRHMGVPVKKAVQAAANGENILAVVAGTTAANAEKKKRKR